MFKAASSSSDSNGRFFLSSCCNFGVVIGRSAFVHSPVLSLHVIYLHVKVMPCVFLELNRDQIETRSFRFVGCGYTIRRYSPDKEPQRGNVMVRVEMAKWGQCLEDLRRASLGAAHPRTRERFQALYLIASGQFNATSCALHVGRHDETVLGWVHRYNAHGPAALAYRRSGGRAPLLTSNKQNRSLRPSRTPSRPTTACPAITGR